MVSYLGIDVSSLSLDAAVRPQGTRLHVSNDPAGFEALLDGLCGLSIKRVLLEATGGYERNILRFLQDAGYKVIRVNPRRARAFAESIGVHPSIVVERLQQDNILPGYKNNKFQKKYCIE